MVDRKLKQYGVLVVGLLLGGGFAFGGIASYSSMVSGGSGGSNSNSQQEIELPPQNVVDGGFNLSLREQAALGYRNEVVFVTVIEAENGSAGIDREALVSEFDNRVYVTEVPADGSALAASLGYNDFPRVVVVSGDVRGGRLVPDVEEPEPEEAAVASAVCRTLNNWGSLAAKCRGR